jgi:hypothetical protein
LICTALPPKICIFQGEFGVRLDQAVPVGGKARDVAELAEVRASMKQNSRPARDIRAPSGVSRILSRGTGGTSRRAMNG